MKHKKYPPCEYCRDGKHRFGVLSFQEVCLFRDGNPDDTCKCAFDRKEWNRGARAMKDETLYRVLVKHSLTDKLHQISSIPIEVRALAALREAVETAAKMDRAKTVKP